MAVKLTTKGELAIKQQLALISLPDNKKRRLLNRVITRIRTMWRRNISQQKDVNNNPFEPRKHRKPSQKKKMFNGLAKYLTVTKLTNELAQLGWSRPKTAIIAKAHNNGMTTQGNAEQLAQYRHNKGKACTKQQIVRLRTLGYEIPAKGGRMKRPSAQWIKDNVSYDRSLYL